MIEIFDCEQGSDDWFACRAGIPTASKFATVMAKGEGKTRSEYMRKLAGEILTGEPMESYTNAHMERGKTMEDEARETYAFINDVEIKRVGFIRNGNKGASPDSLIGEDGGLEIKTALPHIQIERLLRGDLPPEHKAQVQGNLWVAERDWWDFTSYWPKLPALTVKVRRDEPYIQNMAGEIDRFNDELAALVERIRTYGSRSHVLKSQLVQSVMAG
ncbi:YqaJ viral recombinase family protein [Mesorhizobium sp. B2-2-4]|uniref:lambda exonuclease family protein n=1 Tax=unclassified Mesorhizobium TaxID=325217 RepID=UPI00112D241D|nr:MULTISPECIES: lambda exonuclease family protein [unclassified Mesorhizobium]TPM53237.1 YqaJ viral recombinase family protein [Mesorhizobium sp. B2-2-4]TPM62121.1 YqaJ viral recombinase family protein [Mesorhizobium sp. B2-2-1]TPN68492.1 YqaJ viral recombinase family protein [Mesorhizobium sp. B1-1-3]